MKSTAKWVEEWEPSARGYVLISDPGTGKTHYMAAMVRAFIDRGVRERKASIGNQTRLDAQIDIIQTAPVLCIDELARERETQWTEDVLDEVIETRYQSGRTTIIACNGKPADFEAYMGPRLYSRIASMCRLVEFRGLDQRREG
jgi:DNA replication protein DnaC